MSKIGMLLHTYHLGAVDWEGIVWGDPTGDVLGTGPKLAELMLDVPADQEVVSIICDGPSSKDGLAEGAYTKRLLLERLGDLDQFPRLAARLERMDQHEHQLFRQRMAAMEIGPPIRNTETEVTAAAKFFQEQGVSQVIQVAAMTHAPRCIREQGVARALEVIKPGEQWFVTMSDTGFANTTPLDVVLAEPPHRPDDPTWGHTLTWPALVKRYYALPAKVKMHVLHSVERIMSEAVTEANEL